MPFQQVAQPGYYDFGYAGGLAALQWTVKKGAKVQGHVEGGDTAGVTFSLQTSSDGSSWASTTVALHGQALNAIAVVPGGRFNFSINIRPGLDKYVRVVPTVGNGRLVLQNAEGLEPTLV